MFQLLLIWVIELLFYFINIQIFFLLLASIVVFNHHYTFTLVMPWSFRLLSNDSVFRSQEKGFAKDTVNHHDKTFDSKESRVIFLFEIEKSMKFVDTLFKFIL